MPYITTEEVSMIRKAIKANIKNAKFSIKKEHYSGVKISILESSIDFTGVTQYSQSPDIAKRLWGVDDEKTVFITRLFDVIDSVSPEKIISEDGDYGSVPNYYRIIQVGRWDKPFKLNLAA